MALSTARIGAHVSAAGGLAGALPRADAVGAEALQVFVVVETAQAEQGADIATVKALRGAA